MKKVSQIMLSVCVLVVAVAGSAFASPPAPIPEPGTFVLLGIGAAGLVLYKKIKK